MTSLAELSVSIIADVSGIRKAFGELDSTMAGFGSSVSKLGNDMKTMGTSMSMYVTAPLVAMGAGAFAVAMDFDDSMRKVQAVTGETGETFDTLREAALQLGADTAFSSSQAADAMLQLGQAGFTADEILASTTDVLSLASAGALDLGTAAGITANAMQVFGIEAENTQRVVDVLAKGASISTTDIQGLGNALSYAGPVANALGMSLEETVSVLAALSNAGIEGERAGTALRGALDRLATPTDAMIAKFGKYNISLESVNPATHTFTEILDVLSASGVEATDVMALFGQEAGPGVLALLGQGTGAIKEQTLALQNSNGAAQEMAATMEGGVGGAWRQFTGSVETLSIVLGDLVATGLTPVIDTLTRLFNAISSLPDPVLKVVVAVGALAAAIGPVLIVAGTLISSVGAITTALGAAGLGGALATVVGILTGPVAIAIAAFAAAAYIVYQNWDTIGPMLQRTFNTIVEAIRPTAIAIQDFVTRTLASLRAWWDINGPAITQAAERIGAVLYTVFSGARSIVLEFTSGPLVILWQAFKYAIDIIIPLIEYLGQHVGNVIMLIVNLINGDWAAAWQSARNIVSGHVDFVVNVVRGMLTALVSILGAIASAWVDTWTRVYNIVTGVVSNISSYISSAWNAILSTITSVMSRISTSVSGGWNSILATARSVWESIRSAIADRMNAILSTIQNVIERIKSVFSGGLSDLAGIASSAMGRVASAISGSGGSLASAASSAGQRALDAFSSKLSAMQSMYDRIKSINSQISSIQSSASSSSGSSSSGSSGIKRQGSNGTGEENVKIREAHATGGVAGYTGWHWMERGELAIPQQTNWDKLLVQPIVKALSGSSSGPVSAGNVIIQNMPVTLTSSYNFEQLMSDIEKYNSQKRFQRGISL